MEKEERFLTIKEVINRTSLGRSTIYFLIKEKQFPTSIKITNKKVVWPESEVNNWINQKIKEERERNN